MNNLHCIVCKCRTPRNFADERHFDGIYCQRCAPHMVETAQGYQPQKETTTNPPNSGSSIQKPIDPAARWELNLANLKAGAFGSVEAPETLLRYWEAQEAAGYPGASENVQYFKDLTAKEDTTNAN